jgi:serine/threonine-protein kinase
MAPPPTRPSGPYRPTRLGQWEVIAKIAGGGMSAVYLGRRAEPAPEIPNVVALKIARHELRMDERMLNMFLEEGKLIARLVHPNIVRTLEVGGDAELDYIAMELMLGKTFASIHDAITLREVRLNPEIVAWTAARIADALHYAHELADEAGRPLGLVHRDVNPANVFATFQGEVKLFDFGLAKVTAGDASGSHLLAGKLSYLSPEQIMQMPLDRRSDIFSLGTTLWELLTGRRLFRRDSDLDTVRAVQLGPIPDPRVVAPEIPEELARIAKTALERNREHRYPSAAYLARELDAFVYQRSSASEVTARLAQLVDTLFPGEQKRQVGWLKPAISGSRQMTAVTPPSSVSPSSQTRPAPPAYSGGRETTEVMPNAPLRGTRPKAPTPYADTSPELPHVDTGLRDSMPGPVTPRDGVLAFGAPSSSEDATLVPSTERGAAAPGYSQPPVPSSRSQFQPISSTMTAVAAPVASVPPEVPSTTPPTAPASTRPMPPGPLSTRPWPESASRPPPPSMPPMPAAPPPPPPLPQRSRAPSPRVASAKPPPLPTLRGSDDDLSKTDLQLAPPVLPDSPPISAAFPPPPRSKRPSERLASQAPPEPMKPPSLPPRPKRAPIPLPSAKPSVPPRRPTTDPPSSDTQVDRASPKHPKGR